MRFRAVFDNAQCMREFTDIIQTLAKLSKECVMSITADKVHFIANEEFGTSAPLVWVEIIANLYFAEYTMNGLDDNDDGYGDNPRTPERIMLAVSTMKLSHALAALRTNPRSCKLKLRNIQFPCLSVESEIVSASSEHTRQIVHDVPVDVIPRSEWLHYAVPEVPSTRLSLTMPSYRVVGSLVDKIKNMSPTILFFGTSVGEINLVAETEMATITTRYRHLELRSVQPAVRDTGATVIEASCSVDCKKVSMFLSALQLPTLELSCGIQDDHLVHMEVHVREGIAVHSILPAVCM